MTAENAPSRHWFPPPHDLATEFEKNIVRSINRTMDTPEAVSRELALRTLVELHTIKVILGWMIVVVPVFLTILVVVLYEFIR